MSVYEQQVSVFSLLQKNIVLFFAARQDQRFFYPARHAKPDSRMYGFVT